MISLAMAMLNRNIKVAIAMTRMTMIKIKATIRLTLAQITWTDQLWPVATLPFHCHPLRDDHDAAVDDHVEYHQLLGGDDVAACNTSPRLSLNPGFR